MTDVTDDRPILRLGHSPDPDDAFMWWPLFSLDGGEPRIDTGRFRFESQAADIETLNQRAASQHASQDLLEITAISCANYPWVKERYAITACGASMGQQYGPKLVSRRPLSIEELRRGIIIAVPGEKTTAFAVMRMLLDHEDVKYRVVPFDQIIERVQSGEFEAGLIIHEGQLTYAGSGLHLIADLGAWWWEEHGLPLPLGINVVRRDLEQIFGEGTLVEIATTLRRSVAYAMEHRDESIRYAMGFARDLTLDLAERFISMYVNKWTLDFGEQGQAAVRAFLTRAHEAGLTAEPGSVDFVDANCEDGIGTKSRSFGSFRLRK